MPKDLQTQFIKDEHSAYRPLVSLVQLLTYPFLLLLRLTIVRSKLSRHRSIRHFKTKKDAVYILYGNHQSRLDPLIICACLPFRVVLRLLPFRVMVANEHLTGFLGKVFGALGSFPAFSKPNTSSGLDRARVLLATRQTIIMFPQGMRTRERTAKTGISVLATEPNVHLIPIHINWTSRYRCQVHIGRAFKTDIPLAPDQFMHYVYDLPDSLPFGVQ